MNTPDSRLRRLRIEAFPYLPGSDFDEAFREVREYHAAHPAEELVLETPNPRLLHDRQAQHTMAANHQATLEKLHAEHRETLVTMLQRRDVPRALAEALIDELVLNE